MARQIWLEFRLSDPETMMQIKGEPGCAAFIRVARTRANRYLDQAGRLGL